MIINPVEITPPTDFLRCQKIPVLSLHLAIASYTTRYCVKCILVCMFRNSWFRVGLYTAVPTSAQAVKKPTNLPLHLTFLPPSQNITHSPSLSCRIRL